MLSDLPFKLLLEPSPEKLEAHEVRPVARVPDDLDFERFEHTSWYGFMYDGVVPEDGQLVGLANLVAKLMEKVDDILLIEGTALFCFIQITATARGYGRKDIQVLPWP